MEPLVDRTRKTLDSEKPRTTKTQNICLVPAVSGEVILWNPAIQEFKHLPSQPYLPDSPEIAVRPVGWPEGLPFLQYRHCEYMDALGFGHDPSIVSLLVGNKLENTDNAGFSLFDYSSFPSSHSMVDNEWHSYSVWAMPPDDVSLRIKKVMESLRLEFGGPEIEPHIPVVGSLRMTHEEVLNKFRSLQSCVTSGYKAKVNQVVIRSFYYQCVSLLIDSSFDHSDESFELWRATRACGKCFGFCIGARPHLSLLYGNLTEEEKKKAQEKVSILDESITSMSFPITRLALYKIDYKDKSLKSWDKIAEHTLQYFI
ncbi:hypothetical protein M0R45_028562 [Rubus argutus]|uniref:Uncharacterized protein n=1 Tax=Rubus argutus TaxID=59490 RepID=A0AAW1W932_RUBAR